MILFLNINILNNRKLKIQLTFFFIIILCLCKNEWDKISICSEKTDQQIFFPLKI